MKRFWISYIKQSKQGYYVYKLIQIIHTSQNLQPNKEKDYLTNVSICIFQRNSP